MDNIIDKESMKTSAVGIIGTATTITVHQWSDLMAAIAGTLTAVYMLIKLILLITNLKRKDNDDET